MQVIQSLQQLSQNGAKPILAYPVCGRGGLLQFSAPQIRHHVICRIQCFETSQNFHDVGMIQPRKHGSLIDEALQRLCKPLSVFSGSGFHFQRRGSTPGVLTWQAFLYHNLLTIPLINSLIGDTKTTTSQHLLHLVVSKINRQRQRHRFYNITVLYSMR